MKVFLDDWREAPEGWVRTHTVAGTMHLLQNEDVSHLSLDHDLGLEADGTGYDVLERLEELVYHGKVTMPMIYIHTDNPGAAHKMRQATHKIAALAVQ